MTEWGYRSYGRGESDEWFSSKEDALNEMRHVEDKHLPVVLISRETAPVQLHMDQVIRMERGFEQ